MDFWICGILDMWIWGYVDVDMDNEIWKAWAVIHLRDQLCGRRDVYSVIRLAWIAFWCSIIFTSFNQWNFRKTKSRALYWNLIRYQNQKRILKLFKTVNKQKKFASPLFPIYLIDALRGRQPACKWRLAHGIHEEQKQIQSFARMELSNVCHVWSPLITVCFFNFTNEIYQT